MLLQILIQPKIFVTFSQDSFLALIGFLYAYLKVFRNLE